MCVLQHKNRPLAHYAVDQPHMPVHLRTTRGWRAHVDVGRDVLPDAASIALQVLARAAFSFFFFAKFIKLVSLH